MRPTHLCDRSHVPSSAFASTIGNPKLVIAKGSFLLAAAFLVVGMNTTVWGTTYFSQASGSPTTPSNWNTNRLGGGATPANFTSAGNIFVIQGSGNGGSSPHSLTTTAGWTVSGSGSKLQIESGATLTAAATFAVTIGATATFQVDAGGTYVHQNTSAYGSSIFNGTTSLDPASTVILNNSSGTGPSGVSFGNLTINFTSDPGANVSLGGGITAINGNLSIVSTSTREFRLAANSPASLTITLGGDLLISGGTLNLISGTTTLTLNVAGNFNQSGGTLTSTGSGIDTFNFTGLGKTFTQSAGTVTNTNINWAVTSGASLTLANNLPVAIGRTVTVNGTLNCGTIAVQGAGAFTLAPGAKLGIGSTAGITSTAATGNIQVTGTRAFNTAANYVYNGSANQAVGDQLPATVADLNIANTGPGTVTLAQDTVVSAVLTLTSGKVKTGSNTLTLGSSASTSGGSTSSYVIGNLKKNAVPNGSSTFPVGTNNGYTPVDLANASGGGDLTVTPKTPQQPLLNPGSSLQEYWTLTKVGTLTTDLTFTYLQGDVAGNEGNYRVIVVESGTATSFPSDGLNVFIDTVNNSFTRKAVQSFSDWTVAEPVSPTAVKLIGFSATRNRNEVMLQWQSGYEVRNLGYNLYREQNGRRTLITPSLVAGSALLAGRQAELTAGLSYTWFDRLAEGVEQTSEVRDQKSNITYWLEDVDLDGTRTLHGPITPAVVASKTRDAARSPLLGEVSPSKAEAGVLFNSWPAVRLNSVCREAGKGSGCERQAEADRTQAATALDDQRLIAATPGVKLAISKAGWYRVTQPELVAAGLPANVNAAGLQLFADAQQVPIKVSGNGVQLTSSDYIEFYGHGLNSTTDFARTYYLIAGNSAGLRIGTVVDNIPLPPPSGPTSFEYTVERRERSIYFSGLLNGDAENFFGRIVSSTPVSQAVPASQLDQSAGTPAQLEVTLQGVTNISHTVRVQFNTTDIGAVTFANANHSVQTLSVPAAALHNGDNIVQLTALGGSGDVSLIDTLRLTYAHTHMAENDALSLGISDGGTIHISGFTSVDVRAVDITDPANMKELTPSLMAQPDGSYTADLRVASASSAQPHTLLVFADAMAAHPDTISHHNPSTWNANMNNADYLIITTARLAASVEPLAALRRSRGMQVSVVDVEDLYDEFSFGMHSPQALHDFIQLTASTWRRAPLYVLLVGDSSYDPKNYLGRGLNDLVPTKLIDTTQTETASDDWLADFNGDGVADLAIGRLPVRTSAETATIVSKIISYENNPIDPQRGALLVADRTFEAASNSLQSALPADLPVQTINRSSGDDSTIHHQIISSINQGPRVTNYFGHGSNGVWTSAFLLSSLDAPLLTNTKNLSVFTMMTCYNGYFQDALNDSLSEALLKSPGGAVAVWASTSLTEPFGQSAIDQEFYRQTLGAQASTLGDAARRAKLATNDSDVRRTWTLFGDPAMRLSGVSPTATSGTLGGTITDSNGSPLAGTTISLSGAQTRQTITDGNGVYSFDNLETNGFYSLTPARANYTFSPASRSFSLLWAHTEASFTGSANGVNLNPLDTTEFFVRQQYLDFLGREPDESGFNFWSNQIRPCGNDPACQEIRRINTSAAFFLSIEFQQTGYEVYRMYKAAYGNLPNAPVPLKFSEFLPDTQKLGHGVVVGRSGWEQALEDNKRAFGDEFVLRSRFAGLYGSMADAQFVEALNQNAGGALTQSERDQLVQELSSGRKTRAQTLRSVAENAAFTRAEFNRAFVLMEYFGYLRRDPNQGADTDFAGYNFWLNKLDHFDGNFANAEMVKAFLVSREYLQRFGP